MTKPKVTVTLGRAGHVVRRRDHLDGGNGIDVKFSSGGGGGKRSIRDRLGSNGESSSYSGSKRQRGVGDELRPGKQIGKNDLRLKLLRKKRSLQVQRDAEELRKVDLRGKLRRPSNVSRTVRIMPQPQHQSRPTEDNIPRPILPPRNSDNSHFLESSRRPYSSWELDELRTRSPERMARPTQDVLPPRISSQMREDPSLRSADAFRSSQLRNDDLLMNYRSTGGPDPLSSRTVPAQLPSRTVPASLPSRAVPDSSQLVRQLPSSNSLIRSSPFVGEEPTTVSGLLQSLGLSKYYINFQAEEVDMPTLRQMGDIDLKEMGIPMGPRKKILLAISSRVTRRPS